MAKIQSIRLLLWDYYQNWKHPGPPASWRTFAFIVAGGLLLTPLVRQLPLLGYDWRLVFYRGILDPYPPWVVPILAPLRLLDVNWSLAALSSISLVGVATMTALQTRTVRWDGLFAALLVLLTPPLWYMLWDGQIDGLVTIALLILPWSVPIALLRPQTLGWTLATRRATTVIMIGWLLLSFVIWPGWLAVSLANARNSLNHPTAMGWATLGWPILLVGIGMWLESFREGNFWRLLAAGMLASPYVQPYHMVMLLPVLGRVTGWKRLVLWLCIWITGILVPGFAGNVRYVGLLFPIAVWWLLRPAAHDAKVAATPAIIAKPQ